MTQADLFSPTLETDLGPGETPVAFIPPPNARKLVAQVIEAAEDFEFYPTTSEIIGALIRDSGLYVERNEFGNRFDRNRKFTTVLDIGAGNGKVLNALQKANEGRLTLHAIEKSTILCQQLDPEILIVGTDFHEQSLLSKQVDMIFCNPPYREFELWAEKIIRQSSAPAVYLVIPERWPGSGPIQDAIRFRDAQVHTVGRYDFENAEDRTARCKVHLLRIEFKKTGDDAFERFFNEQFADLIGKFKARTDAKDDSPRPLRNFKALVVGPNYPEALVALYREEMAHVERNYGLVAELDVDLLNEFGISPARIMECLKTRLDGLRTAYWSELFSRLRSITDRLCHKSRQALLETLQKHVAVDFTVSNICAVLIWVIKNANRYMDSQLIATYEEMVEKANVTMYKSNQRTFGDDRWRYNDAPEPTHYALDYRIVTHRMGGIKCTYSCDRGLEDSAYIFLGDLLTIANNLGFTAETNDPRLSWGEGREKWQPGERQVFYFTDKAGNRLILFDVRAFKNRNIHIRFNQKFMLALNVEHGRLRGWLRSGEEAARELDEPTAAQFFNSNVQLANGDPTLLLQ